MPNTRSTLARLVRLRGSERCLACGRPLERNDEALELRGSRIHRRCATYRRGSRRR